MNLTKVYPNGTKANDGLNITVNKGEVVGIIRPNGAGKTTLIRQILGLLRPTEGHIELLGEDISGRPDFIKSHIGYAPQNILFFPLLTVRETIEYALKFKGLQQTELVQRVEEVLSESQLAKVQDLSGYMLSSGLKRLLLVYVALAQDPPLVILDEPTAMVDIVGKTQMWNLLSHSKDKSILIASHDMNEIKSLCGRVYVILNGKVVAEGSPEEISALMKMPVEVTLIPTDRNKVHEIISHSRPISCERQDTVMTVSFEDLGAGLDFVRDVRAVTSIQYLYIESPSFEKTVLKLMEGHHA